MNRIDALFATANFTAKSVIFANANGKLVDDPNKIVWDFTNNRLGLGTAFPTNALHVSSTGVGSPQFRLTDVTSGCEATLGTTLNLFDIDVLPDTNADPGIIRMFRSTFSLDEVSLQILLGNDTGTINAKIAGRNADTYFCASNGSVGIGTATIDACAKLEIMSTNKGVLFPRMTTAQRNAIPSSLAGLQIFNTTLNVMQYKNSANWMTYTATVSA